MPRPLVWPQFSPIILLCAFTAGLLELSLDENSTTVICFVLKSAVAFQVRVHPAGQRPFEKPPSCASHRP